MKKNKFINIIIDNLKTWHLCFNNSSSFKIFFFFNHFTFHLHQWNQHFLVGDRLFVSKYEYGYSKHSFPFSPPIYNKRIFSKEPNRGDLVVFKTPADNRTDYIKRLIGLPWGQYSIYKWRNIFK